MPADPEPLTARESAVIEPTPAAAVRASVPHRPEWAPRMWQGMNFGAWWRLLRRNRFGVMFFQWHTALIVTVVSLFHSLFQAVERRRYGRQVAATEFPADPIFIVGHWRTGTTWLHELLTLDERHTYPNTFECMEPNHFVLSESLLTRLLGVLMPAHRPMDGMAAGWDRPQEDEFALCMMGQPSPYLKIAFPNNPAPDEAYFDLETLSPAALDSWKRDFVGFLRRVTFRRPKRLVLKSPTHSYRIRTLLELFPDARFVHIVRDPRVVFPSTVHLWRTLWSSHGLQIPRFRDLHEYVFRNFLSLYDKLDEGRRLVDPSRFYELRYEDLVADPVGEMQALYDHLGLGGFDEFRPRLESYLAGRADYRTNRYELEPELLAEVERRWGGVIRRYGY